MSESPVGTAAILAEVIRLAEACHGRTGLLTRQAAAEDETHERERLLSGEVAPEQALYDYLVTLPVGVIYLTTAVMYLGRDGMAPDSLVAQYEHVSDTFTDPTWAIAQLVKKRHALARFLTNGTTALVAAGRDLDRLP